MPLDILWTVASEMMLKRGWESLRKNAERRRRLQAEREFRRNFELYTGGPLPALKRYDARSDYWTDSREQARLTAVVSGKGGVGKTLITLGLAELSSKYSKVLLVDFDLHNRGLTSKLVRHPIEPETRTTFDELQHYLDVVRTGRDPELVKRMSKEGLSAFDRKTFFRERNRFSYEDPEMQEMLRLLSPRALPRRESMPSARAANSVWEFGRNVSVMPSRKRGQVFLGSGISSLDAIEIALFLKYLACLAWRHGVSHVILDCHGAHDMFMTGAVIASDDLLVVSEPDEGALLGTIELLAFADHFLTDERRLPRSAVLLVNGVRDGELDSVKRTVDQLLAGISQDVAASGSKSGDPIERRLQRFFLAQNEDLRAAMKYYEFPTVSEHDAAWGTIIEAARALSPTATLDDSGPGVSTALGALSPAPRGKPPSPPRDPPAGSPRVPAPEVRVP